MFDYSEFFRGAQNLTIAIYSRSSTLRQKINDTTTSQNESCKRFLREVLPDKNITFVEYEDANWYSDSIDRPAMNSLYRDAKQGALDAVICDSADRVARGDQQSKVFRDFADMKVPFFITNVTNPFLNNKEISPVEVMQMRVLDATSQFEKDITRSRFHKGKIRKAMQKKIQLSVPPYGYSLQRKFVTPDIFQDSELLINEPEAQVVRQIFHWIGVDGYTVPQVIKKLHRLGLKPRKSKTGIWASSSIQNMIKNPTYIGKPIFRKLNPQNQKSG
jgi:site-specific DNA recombinase